MLTPELFQEFVLTPLRCMRRDHPVDLFFESVEPKNEVIAIPMNYNDIVLYGDGINHITLTIKDFNHQAPMHCLYNFICVIRFCNLTKIIEHGTPTNS
jgi:hypothetical protein